MGLAFSRNKTMKPLGGNRLNRYHPLAQYLVLLWGFNEGQGNALNELAYGQQFAATFDSSWRWTQIDGLLGLERTGSGSLILPNRALPTGQPAITLQQPAGFTVEWYGRTDHGNGGNNSTCIRRGLTPNISFQMSYVFPRYQFEYSADGTTVFAGIPASTDLSTFGVRTFHVVGVYTGTQLLFYRDGELDVASVTFAHNFAHPFETTSSEWFVGDSSGSNVWDGTIFKAAVYNKGLSAAEVKNLFADPWGMIGIPGLHNFLGEEAGPFVPPTPPITGDIGGNPSQDCILNQPCAADVI